ncbi:SEC11-like 3-like protein [Polychytrium aggregatum]|uniref:SEC11-like 3-like protein n=1 Tax=Polychytrium aggregatum TaxID=110093 RepID=UPI0022FDD4FB|nr:SEC11-like 3-like protein [Polychytrium aggregatum]KAI9199304.1 SEC11-like 3-like protein [Polychytrium aggregatum]
MRRRPHRPAGPATDPDRDSMDFTKKLSKMSIRQIATQLLQFCLIISSALMIWKTLAVVMNTESPIVVVLSESMEPAFQRGDLLFLATPSSPIRVGDICVYKLKGKEIPIVHRVLRLHDDASTGKQFLLTKGDNNPSDDRALYNRGQLWVHEDEVIGRVQGYLPYIGMVTILLNDYPQLKVVLLAGLGLTVLFSKDE